MGIIPYKEAWDYQKNLFEEIIELKSNNKDLPLCEQVLTYNYLLFCEHPHVYTMGKHGQASNLLISREKLKSEGIEYFHIERGGDITYHGPGQIVGYPVFDLETFGLGLRAYIETMEEAIINTMADFGIAASRLSGATGVWIDAGIPEKARKICAIGVKASRHVTMHGFALNVNTNLSYYQYMNPCGITDKGVTSMEKELNTRLDTEKVKKMLLKRFSEAFDTEIITNF